MTEGAAEPPANQRRGVVSRFDDRGVLLKRLKIDLEWTQEVDTLL